MRFWPSVRSIAFMVLGSLGLMGWLVLLAVAGVCGVLGQAIAGYSAGGCLASIALGFIGALLGIWIAGAMHLPELFSFRVGVSRFPVVWSIVGSALFVGLMNLFRRPGRRSP